MKTLLLVLAVSFALTICLVPLIRRLALRYGLVDHPDGHRKLHNGSIPLGGGVAVFLAGTVSLLVVLLAPTSLRDRLVEQANGLIGLLVGAFFICGMGLVDDFRTLRGRHKLLGQLIAVGAVISSGVLVRTLHIFGWEWELGPLALPFTVLWLLGAINSLNLIDGMDGLLATIGTILCLAMAVLAVVSGQWAAAAVACALAGALLAFLCFNFPPASIFLGDCGSMLVGLVVGVIAIQASLKGPATIALAAPTALLTIPLFDSLAAILRRKLTGRSIYTTDRGHIHHCLLRRGLSGRRTLLVLSTLCLLSVAGCLASIALDNELFAAAGTLLVVNILVVGRLFGHAEFLLLKERLTGTMARLLKGKPGSNPRQMEVHLQGSADWAELWAGLVHSAQSLELETICLDVNAPAIQEGYHARWDRGPDSSPGWQLAFPLMMGGQSIGRVEMGGQRTDRPLADRMANLSQWIDEIEHAVGDLASVQVEAEPAPRPLALLRTE